MSDRPTAATTPAMIESDLRLFAFQVHYARTFADEKDAVKRFARSLLASMAPIRNPAAVVAWHARWSGRGRSAPRVRMEEGPDVTADQWEGTDRMAAADDEDDD